LNIQKYEQELSTFKRKNKNLLHSKAIVKAFNISKSKNRNLQCPKPKPKPKAFNLQEQKTKAFNLSKSKNKNL
jgi:hypothetical protein